MSDIITLTGLVSTEPRHLDTPDGTPVTSFRLASQVSDVDETKGVNWYTITSTDHLARNARTSIHKGDRVLVTGRLRIRDWSTTDRSGLSVEVEAISLGHDLVHGVSSYTRTLGGDTIMINNIVKDLRHQEYRDQITREVARPEDKIAFALPNSEPTWAELHAIAKQLGVEKDTAEVYIQVAGKEALGYYLPVALRVDEQGDLIIVVADVGDAR